MLLNSLSFYLSFSVYFDCGLVFIIKILTNINLRLHFQGKDVKDMKFLTPNSCSAPIF